MLYEVITHIDVDRVRIGARDVEGMNPAVATEPVLRRPRVEPVCREVIATGHELELLGRHDQVQKPLLRADRTIALRDS